MTVKDAGDMWIERTRDEYGKNGNDPGVLQQYKTLMARLQKWAQREHIDFIQDITPIQLENWYRSHDWKKYAETTRRQRWGCLRSFFHFLKEQKGD